MKSMIKVSEAYKKKSWKLSEEMFDYLAKHEEIHDMFPKRVVLVINVKNDKKFNDTSLAIAMSHHDPDEPLFIAQKSRRHWEFDRLEPSSA